MARKKEPELFPGERVAVNKLTFGEWAICPKCRARVREVMCKRCLGTGVVPNVGPIPFTKDVGKG